MMPQLDTSTKHCQDAHIQSETDFPEGIPEVD